MLGGDGQIVALFGESGQLEVRAEVIGAHLDGLRPAFDARGQRRVDIAEGLLGSGVAGLADAVKDAPFLLLLLGFVAQKGVLHGRLGVVRVDLHGFAELVAGQLVLADLQVGVGQVFVDGGAARGSFDSLEETCNGGIVIAPAQRLVRAGERLVGRVRGLGEGQPANRKKHHTAHSVDRKIVGRAGQFSQNYLMPLRSMIE